MDQLTTTQGAVGVAGVILALVALVTCLLLVLKLRRLQAAQTVVLGEGGSRNLTDHAAELTHEFGALEAGMSEVAQRLDRRMTTAERRIDKAIAHRGLVRYDAYNELSGRQSMSIALLDAERSGIVFSSIHNTPIKADGIIAIKIREDDELVAVRRTSGDDELIMVSRSGQAVRFKESDVRGMGRDTSGVRGMNVSQKDNAVLAMDVADPSLELLVITENGYGKRTPIEQYRETKRGAMGVKTIKLTDDRGGLAGAMVVREHEDLVFISQNGMVQRTPVRGVSQQGRATQGVRLMNVKADDQVSAVAVVIESDDDDDGTAGDGAILGMAALPFDGHGDAADQPDTPPAPVIEHVAESDEDEDVEELEDDLGPEDDEDA